MKETFAWRRIPFDMNGLPLNKSDLFNKNEMKYYLVRLSHFLSTILLPIVFCYVPW